LEKGWTKNYNRWGWKGSSEAGSSEAGSSEAGSSEAGSSEAGSSEAGSSEAGSSEAGSSEAVSQKTTFFQLLNLSPIGCNFWSNLFLKGWLVHLFFKKCIYGKISSLCCH